MKTKDNRETNKQTRPTEPLADLELTGEQAEETKAGTHGAGGVGAGKVQMQDFHFVAK